MRILLLIVLICNVSALILALISMYITNRAFKEYERRMKLARIVCDSTLYLLYSYSDDKFSKEEIKDTLLDIINIIERGYR